MLPDRFLMIKANAALRQCRSFRNQEAKPFDPRHHPRSLQRRPLAYDLNFIIPEIHLHPGAFR